MRNLLNKSPSDDFYIFDELLNCFYHLFEKADWKIAKLPYDKLQDQVNSAYVDCGASLPEFPNAPTNAQVAAMTDSLQWGQELVSTPPKYQLELYFDPEYRNSSFISCFNEKITNWINDYNQSQGEHDYRYLIGILVAVAVVGIVCCVGFAVYQKYQERKHVEKRTTGPISIFPKKRDEEMGSSSRETTRLLEMSHPHVAMNAGSNALGATNPMFRL